MEFNDSLILSLLTTHQFFFSVGVVEIQCGEMSLPQGNERLEYNFKFNKLGLEPIEYEQCLQSKLDSFLDGQSDEIKNLARKSMISAEKEVRIRQISGKKDTKMDERLRATQLYIDEGYLEGKHDTPWKHNNRSGGSQGNEKKAKKWTKEYHEKQEILLEKNLVKSRFCPVDPNNKSTVHFCNAIDGVTANLIRDLSDGKQLNSTEVEEVYELCGRIVRGRTAVDWANENNLFIDRVDKWKNHVLVIMSFSALMVVADMIHRKLEGRSCVKRRARNIFPFEKAGLGSLVFFVTAVPMYFGAFIYDVLHDHIIVRLEAFSLVLSSFVYILLAYFNYFYFSTFFFVCLIVYLILNYFFPAQS